MYKMFKMIAETYENNSIAVIVDDNDTWWLNGKACRRKI